MKDTVKYALIFAGLYIVFEVVFLMTGHHRDMELRPLGFFANSLCLLLAIAVSIVTNFNKHKHRGLSMIVDIKTGIRTGVFYSLIISAFLFGYYRWMDPEYAEILKQQHIEMTEDPEYLDHVQEKMKQDPDFYKGNSAEDLRDNEQTGITTILDPNKIFLVSLLAMVIGSIVYAFAVTAFNRMVLAKLR